ncbi:MULTISPECIES: hypothetical protein [Kamptonema]|uniref:hypothetical protein n=1 Tax=Kamptonema TaxID=1501433 RepID=UPI0001DAC51E|nr:MULTISPECIES: hypothetical protein [Kamptonema]CBN54885.1 hypothetical protein OSCI_1130003 [Kamptonema sp. PCC 6506]
MLFILGLKSRGFQAIAYNTMTFVLKSRGQRRNTAILAFRQEQCHPFPSAILPSTHASGKGIKISRVDDAIGCKD